MLCFLLDIGESLCANQSHADAFTERELANEAARQLGQQCCEIQVLLVAFVCCGNRSVFVGSSRKADGVQGISYSICIIP